MKKIILSVAVAVFLLAGIALLVMYNMGDRLIEEAIKSELQAEDNYMDQIENGSGKIEQIDGGSNKEELNAQQTSSEETNKADEENNPAKEDSITDDTMDKATSPGAIEATPSAVANNKAAESRQSVKETEKPSPSPVLQETVPEEATGVTSDKISDIRSEVSASDKITAAAMVLKRLSASDVKELKDMLSSGLSPEEMKRAKEIAYAKFSEEELKKIKDMYEKYMQKK